jgi:opacity protein-like surface antigen
MRKYLFAGAAALAIATPAAATTDNSGYVGIEGGIMWPKSQHVQGQIVFTDPDTAGFTRTTIGNYRFKRGLDLDFVGGYDFGMFRVEGELGYKHAKAKRFSPNTTFITAINTGAGTAFTTTTDFGVPRSTSVYSAMLNGLLDLGGNGSFGGYAGAGVGYASVHQFGDSKGKLAWQLIAGAYAPIGGNIDIGLKYRYFHAGSNRASRTYAFTTGTGTCGPAGAPIPCSGGTATFYDTSRFTSNNLLASLIYSFGVSAPPPPPVEAPPPPPPEAPATQTCPDGSVILATSTCPAPPPPPPPPPAPTERGERGQ